MENKKFNVTNVSVQRQILAEELIDSILHGNLPKIKIVRELGGQANLADFFYKIEALIESSIDPYRSSGNRLRPLVDFRESEIYKENERVQSSTFFKEIEESIISGNLPDKKFIMDFYEGYGAFAYKTIKAFQKLGKPRNCGRPYVIHPIRASLLADALGFDSESGKPNKYYTALMLMHDNVEEFLYALRNKDGELIYGFENIERLLNDYIPEEMHADEMMLTNEADIIMDHLSSRKFALELDNLKRDSLSLAQKKYRPETKRDILYGLDVLLENPKYEFSHGTIQKMKEILKTTHIRSGRNTKPGSDAVKEDALWEFYSRIYLNDLAEEAYESGHFNTFQLKGLDLRDNCETIEADKYLSKRRVILKSCFWVDKANWIILRAKANNMQYPKAFENRVAEIMDFANYTAHEFLITYFARPVSKSSHFDAGIQSLKLLRPVLYKKENAAYSN